MLAELVLKRCKAQGLMLSTAESCTGGLISSVLTSVAGSSVVVERCFITYSNEAKHSMLGVPKVLIEETGAVSEEVARAMAEGVIRNAPVQLGLSVTGIAGPGGGSVQKPLGSVHIAVACDGRDTIHRYYEFEGDRNIVRAQAVDAALVLLLELLEN